MQWKWVPTILFGLLTIWTGLWRGVEAEAWFCMAMGIVAISAAFLFRLGKQTVAVATALVSVAFVLGFYP